MKFIEKLFLKDLRLTGKIVLTFFLALAILIFLIHGTMVLFFEYPLDYGEGPLLNQALRVTQGEPLYPADLSSPPYLISNYPPVYILVNAFFVWLFGPSLFFGRLIAFLSTIGTAGLIALIIRRFSPEKNTLAMLTGAAIFLAIPYVLEWSALYRIDMLALFFSIAGATLILLAPEKNRNIILGAVLFLLAAYTRQSFGLAGPVAAVIWLWFNNRKQVIKLLAIYSLGGIAVFGLLQWLTGGGFFFHIITANVNPFSWNTVLNYARDLLSRMPYLIVILLLYLALGWRRSKAYAFLTPYLLSAFVAALTIGKIGSNINYLVEISAGFAMLSGIMMSLLSNVLPIPQEDLPEMDFPKESIPKDEEIKPGVRRKLWVNLVGFLLLTVVLVLQFSTLLRGGLFEPVVSHRNRIKPEKDYIYLEENIRKAAENGPVLADEFMASLPNNDLSLYIQPFEMTQLSNAGQWDQTPFLEAIKEQQFPLILIHHYQYYPVYLERWTLEMREAIFDSYVATEVKADSLFFVPKDDTLAYPMDLSCPDVPWSLPTSAEMGIYWQNGQLLMMGDGRTGEVPVYAVADGELYQFPGWQTAVVIKHDDPFNPGKVIWSFYGDLAPAYDAMGAYILADFQNTDGVPVGQGDLIGYQGRWYGPDEQTWVHLRFTLVPADESGEFPEVLMPIADPNADLPSYKEQQRLGLGEQVSLSRYTGLPESDLFGALDFLPFACEKGAE